MIINIRGTSGTGKTHMVRAFMADHPGWETRFIPERKRPLGYFHPGGNGPEHMQGGVYVVGNYECACGGTDTLPSWGFIHNVVREAALQRHHVLFEGLLWSHETKRTIMLSKDFQMQVWGIHLPIEECLDSINVRRRLKNPDAADVNPASTISGARQTKAALLKLEANGVRVVHGTRNELADLLEHTLGALL